MPVENAKPFEKDGDARKYEAYNHYLEGTGSDRKIDIYELTPQLKPEMFSDVRKALAETKGRNARVSVRARELYSIPGENPNKYVIGRINLDTVGTVDSRSDGTQTYQGYVQSSAPYDTYNFNPDSTRSFSNQVLTGVGWLGGQASNGKPYKIYVTGQTFLGADYK